MPMYEYRCHNGHVSTKLRRMQDREAPITCYCGYVATKVILTPPRVFGDFEGYVSPATGAWVEGKRARVEDLKKSGCRPYESGEREQMMLRKAATERELDKTVDAVVDQSMAALTSFDEGSDGRRELMGG